MIDNIKKSISVDITHYLRETIALFSSIGTSPAMYPIAHALLSSAFMQMIGCLEQKMFNIKWYLGFHNEEIRYGIQNNFSRQTIDTEIMSNLYKLLLEEIEKMSYAKNRIDLWKNKTALSESYDKVVLLFRYSSITDYTSVNFQEFCNNKYLRILKSYNKVVTKLEKDYGSVCKTRLGQLKDKLKRQLNSLTFPINDIYDCTVAYRHSIAHNLDALKIDLPTIKKFTEDKYQYETFYYRFMIISYIDTVFREYFHIYIKLHKQHLL